MPRGRSSTRSTPRTIASRCCTFGNGAQVLDADARPAAASTRPGVISRRADDAARRQHQHGRGLYRGWDELRSVPTGQQSGLRIIVLFTDGASNSVPATGIGVRARRSRSRTWDFPDVAPDPDGQTWSG